MPSSKLFAVLCVAGWLASVSTQAGEPGQSTDLVRLGTSLNEATGDLQIARLKLKSVSALGAAPGGVVSTMEVEIAKINVETAERKRSLLTEILNIETEATERQLAALRELMRKEDGKAEMSQVVRAESRLRILKAIAKIR